jgi:hypothetical protein
VGDGRTPKEREHLEDVDKDGRIILKLSLCLFFN